MPKAKTPYRQRTLNSGLRSLGRIPVLIKNILHRTRGLSLLANLGFAAFLCGVSPVLAATAPPLGVASSFAVLGGSTVTNTGMTAVSGDLGVSPGAAVTAFPPGTVTGGTIHANDAAAQNAQTAAATAYNNLTGQACTQDLTGQDLGGQTLTAGVYCFSTSAQLTGTLTLNAQGNANAVFIFQIGSTLTTASSSSVLVTNGGQDYNLFWQVGTSATLGTTSIFAGTIIAAHDITLNAGTTVSGRVLARGVAGDGAVSLNTNTISVSSPLPSITVLKSVQTYSDPLNGLSSPKAIPGSFMLYTIMVTNTGAGTVDNNTTVLTDPIPANTELFVGDINGAGSGPVLFTDGATASGLSYGFASLASAVDNLSFSNNGAASYVYSPTADANQCDATVTHLKISLGGIFGASNGTSNPSFTVKFRIRVK